MAAIENIKKSEELARCRFFQPSLSSLVNLLGGAMGNRTPDLLNAIEALYQLSYDPAMYF